MESTFLSRIVRVSFFGTLCSAIVLWGTSGLAQGHPTQSKTGRHLKPPTWDRGVCTDPLQVRRYSQELACSNSEPLLLSSARGDMIAPQASRERALYRVIGDSKPGSEPNRN
jgi:hypothetical protein